MFFDFLGDFDGLRIFVVIKVCILHIAQSDVQIYVQDICGFLLPMVFVINGLGHKCIPSTHDG